MSYPKLKSPVGVQVYRALNMLGMAIFGIGGFGLAVSMIDESPVPAFFILIAAGLLVTLFYYMNKFILVDPVRGRKWYSVVFWLSATMTLFLIANGDYESRNVGSDIVAVLWMLYFWYSSTFSAWIVTVEAHNAGVDA
jgi:hypothetical protein